MKSGNTFGVGLIVIVSMAAGQAARAVADPSHHREGTQETGSSARPASDALGSAEQAKRGEAAYLDECARCHSDTLSGTEFGPALVGNEFVRDWTGKNIGDMFVRIRETMPVDSPGRLTGQQAVDVIAFILYENKVNIGDQPLAADAAALRRIIINATPVP